MTIGRISTYAIFQNTLRDLGDRQLDLFELQNQISSGKKSENFAGIAGQTEQFIDLEEKISRADLYLQNNKLARSRLEITDIALDQVIDTANSLKTLILSRRNGTQGSNNTFSEQLRNEWQALVAQLNTQSEGRYLFAGAATDTRPVNPNTFPLPDDLGVPDANYYQGSNKDITLRAQDNVSFEYNVRADASGFQKIFAGLANASRGDKDNSDGDLARAFDFIEEGLQEVITLQANVNANKVAIDELNDEHESFRIYWIGIKEEIIGTDLLSASTQVAINEGILQASFQAFSRINSLKLADFLR